MFIKMLSYWSTTKVFLKRYLKSVQHVQQMFIRNFLKEYNVSVLKKCSQVYNNIHVVKAGVRPKYFLMYV